MVGLLLALLSGCGDDGEVAAPEPEFAVELHVRDMQGDAVPGLELGICPDLPWYQDRKRGPQGGEAGPILWSDRLEAGYPSPFFPAAVIRYELEQPAWTRLDILDIEGNPVRALVALEHPAGSQAVMWNGRDDEGLSLPSGVYHAHLRLWDDLAGDPRFEQSRPMLLAAFYPDQALVGVTDADGVIRLTDRRLFPYLYGLEPFPAIDENGDQIGDIVLTPAMRFYLSDPETGRGMRFDRDVTGPATLEFTWEPERGEGR